MRIGIFGGTFDPPHIAHSILAAEAYDKLNLDLVLWVLTPDPPHKQEQPITGLAHRLKMVEIVVKHDPGFELSRVDIERRGPHFAVDTVQCIRQDHADAELYYIMGDDSLRDLPTWGRPDEFVRLCDALGVMRRPDVELNLEEIEASIGSLKGKVKYIDAPLFEISASNIRDRIVHQRTFKYYLLNGVYEYILEHQLYVH